MPIRPEFRKFYRGPAWRATRERIRARAGDRCEQCGAPNRLRIIRRGGYWWDTLNGRWRDPQGDFAKPPKGLRRRIVAIVCTVSHTNHVPGDDRPENLRFLCQWDHFHWDKEHHRETRSIRKDRARPLLQEATC